MITVKDKIPGAGEEAACLALPEELLVRLGAARIEAVIAMAIAKFLVISIEVANRDFSIGLPIEPGWLWTLDMSIWEFQLGSELCEWWRTHDGESERSADSAGGEAPDGNGNGSQNPVDSGCGPPHLGEAARASESEERSAQS